MDDEEVSKYQVKENVNLALCSQQKQMPKPSLKHALFDMDGLLLNTEIIYTQVTQKVLEPFGHQFTWELKSNMIGTDSNVAIAYLIDALQLPFTVQEFKDLQKDLFHEFFPTAQPMPFAKEVTMRLKGSGVKIAVATSSTEHLFQLKTQNHKEWFSIFDTIVTASDPEVAACKPAPDLFLTAAKRLGVNPEDCLVLEDAPSGVEAAKAAGMQVIAIPDPQMDLARYAKADQILTSLEEFDPKEWGLIS